MRVLLIDVDDHDEDGGTSSTSAGPGSEHAGRLEVMTDIAVDDSVSCGNTATTDDRVRIIQQSAYRSAKYDWRRLAVVVDRLFFVIFAVILIATCLAFAGYL